MAQATGNRRTDLEPLQRIAVGSLVAAALALMFSLAAVTKADPDLWGHVRFGLDLLETGVLSESDPYSFTQDRVWVNHEWLSEWQMGAAYHLGGATGLTMLKGALVLAALALVWQALAGVDPAARLLLMAFVASGTARLTLTLRPQLWTFLLLAVTCRLLSSPRGRLRWWLPAVFAIWANLHGGWIVGFGVLAVWTAVEGVQKPRRLIPSVALAVACALATLATPYGWHLWAFLLDTVRLGGRAIGEWQPLTTTPILNLVVWSMTTAGVIWVSGHSVKDRPERLAVLLMLGLASFQVERLSALYLETAAILLAPQFRSRWPPSAQGVLDRSPSLTLTAGLLAAACATGALFVGRTSLRCIDVAGAWTPDPLATALDQADGGRLVVYFDWGQYAIWRWGPRLRVSMDGRRETVYSDRVLALHDALVRGESDGLAALEAWRAEYVWLPATSRVTRRWLESHGYRIDAESVRSFVAVRNDLPVLASPSVPASGVRCFPS